MQAAQPVPVVETASGPVPGWPHPGGAAYLSVPFAAAPVGDRRFLAPVPPTRWTAVRACDAYGPTPQRRPFAELTAVPDPSVPGDDVLSVSVFTPAAGRPDAALPVLAWVHGGAYFAGSPASPWYDGRSFARDGIVTVVISYRLGFDGYGWIDGAPLNRGVLDQIAALEWIRDDIAGFGGDPGRVTIAGQSAGGGSVLTLMASPRARGLFHGVIDQSGAVSGLGADAAEQVGRRLADAAGVAPTLDALRAVPHERILDLERDVNQPPDAVPMSASPDRLVDAVHRDPTASLDLAFAPVVDGDVVVDVPDALAAGRAAEVPLLLGANESDVVSGDRGDADLPEVLAALERGGCSPEQLQRFAARVEGLGGSRFAKGQLLSTYLFRAQTFLFADLRARAGGGERTWLYDFGWRSRATGFAGHCDELPFVWDLLDAEGVARELGEHPPQPLADAMHADWVEFIRTGSAGWSPVAADRIGARRYADGIAHDPDAYRLEAELLGRA